MPPLNLKYGLNVPSKNQPKPNPLAAGQKRKKTIFDDDFDDDEDEGSGAGQGPTETEITTFGSVTGDEEAQESRQPPQEKPATGAQKPTKPGINISTKQAPSSNAYVNLASLHSSKKYTQQAEELDPSIYDYDSVYESLHAKPEDESKKKAESQGPRYIGALLKSAETRKRDQLRARERMLQKEREAEGDEFADKEKFVTSAYKAQQEEVRKIEEEEERKAKEEEERRKKGGGMVEFYKDMLKKDEERHEAAMRATQELAEKKKRGEISDADQKTAEDQAAKEKSEAELAAELNERGANVAVNEEGQIVDKRQLLSAGLNVAPKKKEPSQQDRAADRRDAARPGFSFPDSSRGRGREAGRVMGQRERQTEMIARQLEEKARQQQEEEEARQKELAEKARSHRKETDVQSARERYLARKREREAAAAKGK